MKLYTGFSPNGARVDSFLMEKAIEIPTQAVNIMAGDTRKPEFLKLNSLGEVPVLATDDGTLLTETMAICRYLESLFPETPLLGEDPLSQAKIEMWNRRVELHIFNVIGGVGRHEFELFKDRGQVPEYAEFCRSELDKNLLWLNDEMSDGRPFIAGDAFSVADITGMAALLIMMISRYQIPDELEHVKQWSEAIQHRASFPKMPS